MTKMKSTGAPSGTMDQGIPLEKYRRTDAPENANGIGQNGESEARMDPREGHLPCLGGYGCPVLHARHDLIR